MAEIQVRPNAEIDLASIAAQAEADLLAEIAAGNVEIQPVRYRLLSGGAIGFTNKDTGEVHPGTTMTAIILTHVNTRTYYDPDAPDDVKVPPWCISKDAKWGEPQTPLGVFNLSMEKQVCETCPLNGWSTGKNGKGKACKEMARLLLMPIDQDMDPLILFAPPTSLRNWKSYRDQLASGSHPRSKSLANLRPANAPGDWTFTWAKNMRRFPVWYVITELGIDKVGEGKTAYGKLTLTPVSVVPDQLAVEIDNIRRQWGVRVENITADLDDYVEVHESNGTDAGPFPVNGSPIIDAEPVPF